MRNMEGFSPKGKGPHEVGLEFGCLFVLGYRKNRYGALAGPHKFDLHALNMS